MENRSRNIDLLRKNLNLLQEEFKMQLNRSRKEHQKQKTLSNFGPSDTAIDLIDIFKQKAPGINDSVEHTSEADLNEDEESILKQFEKNDQELEDIAAMICGALDQLKGTAQNIESKVDAQGKMLKNVNKKAEETQCQLSQENNELKQLISKHKNGKQICMDLCLLMVFLLLLGVLFHLLQQKGIM